MATETLSQDKRAMFVRYANRRRKELDTLYEEFQRLENFSARYCELWPQRHVLKGITQELEAMVKRLENVITFAAVELSCPAIGDEDTLEKMPHHKVEYVHRRADNLFEIRELYIPECYILAFGVEETCKLLFPDIGSWITDEEIATTPHRFTHDGKPWQE